LIPGNWLSISLVVAVGSIVQGAIGFGLGLLAAPLLVLIDPALVPGPLLAAALVLTGLMAVREREAIDFHGVGWALAGRVPGTFLGALAVAVMSERAAALVVAILVLGTVVLIASKLRIERTRRALLGAGVMSGFISTISSIGGPAFAVLYQDDTGARMRGTLSSFFLVGLVFSIAALACFGRFGASELQSSLLMLPGVLAGFLLSPPIARVIDRGRTRSAVLAVSAAAGVLVLAQALGLS
jgi:uncharacterized membrane protein YfcA